MLKLNVYCCIVSGARHHKVGSGHCSTWLVNFPRLQRVGKRTVSVKALNGGRDGNTSRFPDQSWEPELEIEVPFDQRPVNEYSALKDSILYSWGELSPGAFLLRLGGLWFLTFTVLGAPIAAASFNPSRGWSYVGDRLLSAVVPYEETGWYDGQMWVKPPEQCFMQVLARDRLLGSYKVKPVIKLLKQTLVGTGAILVTSVFLFIFAAPAEEFYQSTFLRNTSEASTSKISNGKNMRKEELLRLPVEVKSDDDLAAAAAEAADGRPVYCRDRFYRALAGGQYCKWDDLVK
uniref:Uncharacterized protein n=1 Tax=Kalanchoe fedtschenkoi TaxID=63787 RepID=A0A7N0TEH2_KALFE